jgi:hypothetical protein
VSLVLIFRSTYVWARPFWNLRRCRAGAFARRVITRTAVGAPFSAWSLFWIFASSPAKELRGSLLLSDGPWEFPRVAR